MIHAARASREFGAKSMADALKHLVNASYCFLMLLSFAQELLNSLNYVVGRSELWHRVPQKVRISEG